MLPDLMAGLYEPVVLLDLAFCTQSHFCILSITGDCEWPSLASAQSEDRALHSAAAAKQGLHS